MLAPVSGILSLPALRLPVGNRCQWLGRYGMGDILGVAEVHTKGPSNLTAREITILQWAQVCVENPHGIMNIGVRVRKIQ